MSETAFAHLMSSADPALIVATTAAEGEQAGCLVGFHTQSSMAAEQYCFCLSKANHTYRVSLRSSLFGVHLLTRDDAAAAEHFGTRSGEDTATFSGIELEPADHDVPLISSLPNRMVVERIAMLDDGGDHVVVTARVASAESTGPFTPLRTSDVSHLVPGHDSDERAIHP